MPNATSRKIFCDLDGVLCDFESGVFRIFKRDVGTIAVKKLWQGLSKYKSREGHGFYDTLQWTKNGPELWEMIKDLQPTILTGLPRGGWAEKQKRMWCKENLGEHVPVICCWSKEKHLHSGDGCILIDDRLSLKGNWTSRGGMFVHHTDTQPSIEFIKVMLAQENFIGDTTTTTSSALSVKKRGNGGKQSYRKREPRILAMLRRGGGEGVKKPKIIVVAEEEGGREESEKN
eukprot:454145_1